MYANVQDIFREIRIHKSFAVQSVFVFLSVFLPVSIQFKISIAQSTLKEYDEIIIKY